MRPGLATVPRATYRIQFNHECTLAQARALVPYLHDLGISHIYASPLLKAVPGSMHGYDICDFHQLNPEVGTPADFAALHEELARHNMGLVLDVVPNHMGIDGQNNSWWWDVLTLGAASRYARCFDIDWLSPDPRLRGKVAMPVLGQRYHEALAQGVLRLAEKDGVVTLDAAGQTFPVSPESASALRQRGPLGAVIAEINASPKALDAFIQQQHYLLMFWRNGPSMLNYRRFFTIASLAGVRIEDEWVFNEAFALVKDWLAKGWIDGLRVDHVDGLRHPEQFLRRLREIAPTSWIVLEKILEPGEALNPLWPVDGTTGYDFLHVLNGVFIDPEGEKPLSDFYAEFTGETAGWDALVRAKKQMTIRTQLAAESSRLTDLLVHLAARHWECRDFTRAELADAWAEFAVCLPVYRTYTGAGDDPEINKRCARLIRASSAAAREQRPDLPPALFDFLEDLLLLRRRGELEDDFALRFQQSTGAIMAKAVEDTAFFCYPRFAALNEVGGDPGHFGLSLPSFHQWCERQQRLWPGSMAATATHDTKWGGDVRARLALLADQPREWAEAVCRWSKMLESKRTGQWPDRGPEYLFYQALAGAWPLTKERALAYIEKAAREGKEHTSWEQPVPEYEAALKRFVSEAMDDARFMADVQRFVTPLLDLGWINSLAQTLVKLTAAGVPDIYQGSELWDLSLTDPDNRRPVDFAPRRQILAEAKALSAEEAWRRRESGLAKTWLIWKGLAARQRYPALSGAYEPLPVSGAGAARVLAFMRGGAVAAVTPRLIGAGLPDWADTKVDLPAGRWKNVLTDTSVVSGMMKVLTARFPVALLAREEES